MAVGVTAELLIRSRKVEISARIPAGELQPRGFLLSW